jgi:hypothetical protein
MEENVLWSPLADYQRYNTYTAKVRGFNASLEQISTSGRSRSKSNARGCFLPVGSVADPDPPDPHVFGPPGYGSGCISQRYGSGFDSGSGSFYHQAKLLRTTLILSAL